MRILFLHGLDSPGPNPEAVEFLTNMASVEAVIAPTFNYRAFEDNQSFFETLVTLIEVERITVIVGSSFGGYLGYYLSNVTGIPAMLFNPALHRQSIRVPVPHVPVINTQRDDPPRKVLVLGLKDDVVPPEGTMAFLTRSDPRGVDILMLTNEGHRISLDERKKLFMKLLSKLANDEMIESNMRFGPPKADDLTTDDLDDLF